MPSNNLFSRIARGIWCIDQTARRGQFLTPALYRLHPVIVNAALRGVMLEQLAVRDLMCFSGLAQVQILKIRSHQLIRLPQRVEMLA